MRVSTGQLGQGDLDVRQESSSSQSETDRGKTPRGGPLAQRGAIDRSGLTGTGGQSGHLSSLAGPVRGDEKASEAKRLKELEQKNARLKKLLADAHLDKDILKSALDYLGKA